MSQSRPTLPAPVLEAIERLVKAAENHGAHGSGKAATATFVTLQRERRLLTESIERHASSMYEGGIEMGIAQAGSGRVQ